MATEFQKLVWNEIDKIPFGETKSYKDIAINIGKPNASRAVANACGQNLLPVIRPCHRVICSKYWRIQRPWRRSRKDKTFKGRN